MEKLFDGKIVKQSDYPWAKSSWLCLIQAAATTRFQFEKLEGTEFLDKDGEVIFHKLYRKLNISEAYHRLPNYYNIKKAISWNNLCPIYNHQLGYWISGIEVFNLPNGKRALVYIDHMNEGIVDLCSLNPRYLRSVIHLSTVNEYFQEKHRIEILRKYVHDNRKKFFPNRPNS